MFADTALGSAAKNPFRWSAKMAWSDAMQEISGKNADFSRPVRIREYEGNAMVQERVVSTRAELLEPTAQQGVEVSTPTALARDGDASPQEQEAAAEKRQSRGAQADSKRSCLRVRCCQREFAGQDAHLPVKLVVFDLDETLTVASFMPRSGWDDLSEEQKEHLVACNFESQHLSGSRIAKLKSMLEKLVSGPDGTRRILAILTRNNKGAVAVLKLLQAAELADYFSAIWTMYLDDKNPSGAYKEAVGGWTWFETPIVEVEDHKADVLLDVSRRPAKWFPQLESEQDVARLQSLKFEEIVLVDDQRVNFQSESGVFVRRCCKVARYDGFDPRPPGDQIRNMGGIGAHREDDFSSLVAFVEEPWMYEEAYEIECFEQDSKENQSELVSVVVFGFEETLTLGTFMPSEDAFSKRIGWSPSKDVDSEWTDEDILAYNFESPFVLGEGRLAKLRKMLKRLHGDGQSRRMLVILTSHESGAIAILNLLKIAKLDVYFQAIWTFPPGGGIPAGNASGAFWHNDEWHTFVPPFDRVEKHKVNALNHFMADPGAWLPPMVDWYRERGEAIPTLKPESVVLVDSERTNFQSDFCLSDEPMKMPRYCKVARYDKEYRDCGILTGMGGIGAHSNTDFTKLTDFVEHPSKYHVEVTNIVLERFKSEPNVQLELHRPEQKKQSKTKRLRKKLGKVKKAFESFGLGPCRSSKP